MGFIKAFSGAISDTFANQWKEFYVPGSNLGETVALSEAVLNTQNNGHGENTKGNSNIISNGSKFVVPQGMGLVTVQDGAITGFIAEPGGFEYKSDDPNSKSIFAGDGLISTFVKASWEKVKFGGVPGSQQLAFYVNLKPIPDNKFGTQSEIYWDDAFFGTQVGAMTRGSYELTIVDPLLFVKNFVPAQYLQPGAPSFDFADMENKAATQLFTEVVSSLASAFSKYTNDPDKGNRISKIQSDQTGFAHSLSAAVEEDYQWRSRRGLEITSTSILAIEYDEDTKELMKDVKKADALSGARGNSFMQQAAARGMQAAGENGGGTGMAFMGMGMNAAGGMMGAMQQPNTAPSYQPGFNQPQQPVQPQQPAQAQDPTEQLLNAKRLLDAGAISQEEYDQLKNRLLGL